MATKAITLVIQTCRDNSISIFINIITACTFMEISSSEIRNIASMFLGILDRENITSTKRLEESLEREYTLDQSQDIVTITLRPSNLGTSAYTISYTRSGTGIPIEIKVNPSLKYSQVILKSQEEVKGYYPFGMDIFNNIIQNKVIESSEFERVREELHKLSINQEDKYYSPN